MSSLEASFLIRFSTQLVFTFFAAYLAGTSILTARRDPSFGSIILAVFFVDIVLFLSVSASIAAINFFWVSLRETWQPVLNNLSGALLITGSLLMAWIIIARHNPKLSVLGKSLTVPEESIRHDLELAEQERENLNRLLADQHHFLRAAAHDLRAPLRSISGFVDLIVEESRPNAEYVEFIRKALDKMTALIDDLSVLGRIETEPLPLVWIDMNELVQEVVVLFNGEASRVTIDRLPRVYGARLRIFQLMQNLIGNALKFGSTRVRIEGKKTTRGALICVVDDGIGIPAEYHIKIFEQFQRLNLEEQYPGTGIGLTICQKIVNQHKGKIWVDSIPGEGSVFSVLLPYAKQENERASG